jgi:hypothetical protein
MVMKKNQLLFAVIVAISVAGLIYCTEASAVEHSVGAHKLVVEGKDNNFFISRSQGISMSVSPTRPWWCLWLCTTSTTNAEVLNGRAALSGLQFDNSANSCSNCGGLDVVGPTYWGMNVPRPYSRAEYSASIRIDGTTFEVSGVILY